MVIAAHRAVDDLEMTQVLIGRSRIRCRGLTGTGLAAAHADGRIAGARKAVRMPSSPHRQRKYAIWINCRIVYSAPLDKTAVSGDSPPSRGVP